MINNILLISEQTLKRDSLINDNVDPMFINPAIRVAQDQGLQPLIGTQLFEALKEKVNDGTITDTTNQVYKDLLDNYISPFLEFRVMSDILIPLSFKMRNAGAVNNYDDHIATNYNKYMDNVKYLKDYYEDKANFYADRLSAYLVANSTAYPEYYNWKCGDMPANRDAYNTHIFLGRTPDMYCQPDVIIINNTSTK